MPEHLFIAEKPSLAEEIAKAWAEEKGQKASRSGSAWTVGDDAVTWLFGHMYEQAAPHDYDPRYKQWNISDLPIVPDRWKLVLRKDKQAQVNAIAQLLRSAKYVVNAGDAAREGQLLVDEVLIENGWDPFSDRTKRLWVKSMARKDMLEALRSMRANADLRNLYESAACRQRADWLHGMNLSRLYTIQARRTGADLVISVGRVQTPTLKLIVDRDREIEAFKPVDHYLPAVTFRHANGTFNADWIVPEDYEGLDSEGRLVDKSVAEKIAQKVTGKTGRVDAFASTPKSKAPPLPFSLSALQTECSARFGLSAKQTLDVAQALYETHKATTYPRSDSRYLPLSILSDEAPGIMAALRETEGLSDVATAANMSLKSAAWNDSKVSDHHAIIPTSEFSGEKLARMSDVERKVFLVIARSFIAQFHPDYRYTALSAQVQVEGERFKASGRQVVSVGWKVVYGAEDPDEDEGDDQAIPTMAKGDPVDAEAVRVDSKRTKPPPRFTDGTLIAAMANIHRFVQDPEVRKRLKESDGIGTEATRAAIIETLIARKFVGRKGKNLISGSVGRSVTDALPTEVCDPGMTAIWEGYLDRVAKGDIPGDRFMDEVVKVVRKRVAAGADTAVTIKGASIEPVEGHGETCPKCGVGKMVTRSIRSGPDAGKRYLGCDNWRKDDPTACRHAVWPQRTKVEVEPLEGHGKPCPKCGQGKLRTLAVSQGKHKGSRFLGCDARRKDDPNSCDYTEWPRPNIEAAPGDGEVCPTCQKGKLVTRQVMKGDNKGRRFLSCDNWRKGDDTSCKHFAWVDGDAPSASSRGRGKGAGSGKGLSSLSRKSGRR